MRSVSDPDINFAADNRIPFTVYILTKIAAEKFINYLGCQQP